MFQVGDFVTFNGKTATVTVVIDKYDSPELKFSFSSAMYDIEYTDGSGGALVHERELSKK